jgi:hypothetical protein
MRAGESMANVAVIFSAEGSGARRRAAAVQKPDNGTLSHRGAKLVCCFFFSKKSI